MSPLISIIIPTHNRAHTLGRALDSVLMQNYRPLEIIIIDDASTDTTDDFLQTYISAHRDSHITWTLLRNNRNLGIGRTRNRGLEVAQGEYIAFLDSDDEWIRADKLTMQVDFLEKSRDYGLVATAVQIGNCRYPPNLLGASSDMDFRQHALSWHPYQTSTWLFNAKIARKNGPFWGLKCDDYEYLLRTLNDYKMWRSRNGMNSL